MEKLTNKAGRLFHGKRAFVWIAFALLLVAATTRPVNAITSVGSGISPSAGFTLTITEDGLTHPLPAPVIAGDVVLKENICFNTGYQCSDILRFNNNTNNPPSGGIATNYRLFSDCEHNLTNETSCSTAPQQFLQDEFTFLFIQPGTPIVFIAESATGPTTYTAADALGNVNTYIINSDPTGTTAVGGQITLANKLALLAPYIGLASVVAAAASATILYRKRPKAKENKE